jgi:hypothetical protein
MLTDKKLCSPTKSYAHRQKVMLTDKKLDTRLKKIKIGEISLFAIIEKSEKGPI